MKIDQKYFGTFLLIVALIGAFLIAYFTFTNRMGEKASFKKSIIEQDTLKTVFWPSLESSDSVQVNDFKGQFVVIDFWSNWTDISQNSHQQLAAVKKDFPDTLQVIAAAVGLSDQEVLTYIEKHQFPFYFADGSDHFADFNIPGLPAQLIYDANGSLKSVFMGYPDASQYDSLRNMINE